MTSLAWRNRHRATATAATPAGRDPSLPARTGPPDESVQLRPRLLHRQSRPAQVRTGSGRELFCTMSGCRPAPVLGGSVARGGVLRSAAGPCPPRGSRRVLRRMLAIVLIACSRPPHAYAPAPTWPPNAAQVTRAPASSARRPGGAAARAPQAGAWESEVSAWAAAPASAVAGFSPGHATPASNAAVFGRIRGPGWPGPGVGARPAVAGRASSALGLVTGRASTLASSCSLRYRRSLAALYWPTHNWATIKTCPRRGSRPCLWW
jgi:hypothetical protein